MMTLTQPRRTRIRRIKKSSEAIITRCCMGIKTTAKMSGTSAALLGRSSMRKPEASVKASARGCMSPYSCIISLSCEIPVEKPSKYPV